MPFADQSISGQSALQEEATFAETLDSAGIGAAIFDLKMELAACNGLFEHSGQYPAGLCRQGAPLEHFLRHDADNLQEPAVADDFVASWMRRARRRMRFNEVFTRTDGRIFDAAIAPARAGGVVLTFVDITERELAEQAMRKTHERHELVAEASSDGLYDWDIAANQLTVS